MDIVLKDIRISNFRSIRDLYFVFEDQNLTLGSCNYGKTAYIEAICLCLGKTEWIIEEDINNFFVDKKLLIGDPVSRDYCVTVTLSGFPENDPGLYPKWFKEHNAWPFWWDKEENTCSSTRTKESQELACKLTYASRRLTDRASEQKRFFLKKDESVDWDQSQPSVEADFFIPMGVVYFPLICLQWIEEFNEVKEKVLKETEVWRKKQEINLKSVSEIVNNMNRFMEKAKLSPSSKPLSDEDQKSLMEDAQVQMDKMFDAMNILDNASEEPEEKIIKELAIALPWFKVAPDKEKELLDTLKNPTFKDLLMFLVKKSMETGAGRSFEPMVKMLLESEKLGKTCIVIFDEVEHFIPDQILYSFMENLMRVARQGIFISHEVKLVSFFTANEIKEIENIDGKMTMNTLDPLTIPELLSFH